MKGFFFLPFVSFSFIGVSLLIWIDTIIAYFFEKHKWFCKNNLDWYKYFFATTKRADHYSRLFVKSYSLHHHRLFAAVAEGEHKPAIVVNGNAFYNGVETAVLPFGVEEVKFAKLK